MASFVTSCGHVTKGCLLRSKQKLLEYSIKNDPAGKWMPWTPTLMPLSAFLLYRWKARGPCSCLHCWQIVEMKTGLIGKELELLTTVTHGEDGPITHPGSKPRFYRERTLKGLLSWVCWRLGPREERLREPEEASRTLLLPPEYMQGFEVAWDLQLWELWGLPLHPMFSGSQKGYPGYLCERG